MSQPTKHSTRSHQVLRRSSTLPGFARRDALAAWSDLSDCRSQEYGFLKSRALWQCKSCRKQYSAKLGTIFEDSPIKLDKWFCALWMIVSAKNGVSSYEISRALGVTQKTAWFMMHRIRLAFRRGRLIGS